MGDESVKRGVMKKNTGNNSKSNILGGLIPAPNGAAAGGISVNS